MHRFIMNLDFGHPRQVDHKDREATLDNRRQNLRVTLDKNQQNQGKHKNNTSGFKGVCWDKRKAQWRARISAGGKSVLLGLFPTALDAAAAYDAAAKELHGEFAVTNASL
jgi:AP2 domain